jgi:hypothetical protein
VNVDLLEAGVTRRAFSAVAEPRLDKDTFVVRLDLGFMRETTGCCINPSNGSGAFSWP